MGSYGTSFNTNKVFFGDRPRYNSSEYGIYDISLIHNAKRYHLSSVLLYTVYNESLSQNPSDGLKIKGNPYAIVLQRKLMSGGHYRHIVYQPYVLNTFSHSMNDESPISAFDTSTEDNRKGLVDIVYRYGEIYIFRDLNDQLVPITHEFDSSAQPAPAAAAAAPAPAPAPAAAAAAAPAPAAHATSSGASQSVGSKKTKAKAKKPKKGFKQVLAFGFPDSDEGSGSESQDEEEESEGNASASSDGSESRTPRLRKKSKKAERGAYDKDGDDDDGDDD